MQNPLSNKVVCFGELLWDIFPNGQRRAGGAPFNVAYNLHKMGVDVSMVSSVGNDTLGNEIIEKIKHWDIATNSIQVNDIFPTSTVVATIDENNEAHYDIRENVAWDYICATDSDKQILQRADAFIFGSLSTRNSVSKNSLLELLEYSSFNVFDINLRPPYYDTAFIKELLFKAKLAKFNKAELGLVLGFLGKEYANILDGVKCLQDTFDVQEIIVSKGSEGALYVKEDRSYDYPAIKVQVKDTVGSGDSFLAGFISKRLQTQDANVIMQQAIGLSAFITAHEGACPEYSLPEFELFKQKNFPS